MVSFRPDDPQVKSMVVYRDELVCVVAPGACAGEGGEGVDPAAGAGDVSWRTMCRRRCGRR